MAKIRKQDVFFYLGIVVLLVVVGISFWLRRAQLDQESRNAIGALQVGLIVTFVVLMILSFPKPLKTMRESLAAEKQKLAREKRRKKKRK